VGVSSGIAVSIADAPQHPRLAHALLVTASGQRSPAGRAGRVGTAGRAGRAGGPAPTAGLGTPGTLAGSPHLQLRRLGSTSAVNLGGINEQLITVIKRDSARGRQHAYIYQLLISSSCLAGSCLSAKGSAVAGLARGHFLSSN